MLPLMLYGCLKRLEGLIIKQELNHQVTIRQGRKEDAEVFSRLAMQFLFLFIPAEFSPYLQYLMKRLYLTKKNHFSFEHTFFAEINGKIVGVINGFTGKEKRKEEWRTILLMVRYLTLPILKNIFILIKLKLKYLKKISQLLGLLRIRGKFDNTDYYINGLAVFPEYQGKGISVRLLEYIESSKKTSAKTKLFLDVVIDNHRALKVYEKFGFSKTETKIIDYDGEKIGFFRMVKS